MSSRISGGRDSSRESLCGGGPRCRLVSEGSGVAVEEGEGLRRFLPRTETGVRPADGMGWL